MKRSESTRILDKIILKLGKELATVQFESSFVVSQFKDAIAELQSKLQRAKDLKKKHKISTTITGLWIALYATDLSDPISQSFPLGRGKAEEGELLDALVANLNSQHQWLLAYAYEAFERYYKDLYGAIGYLDRNIWRGSDFGKERIKDLRNKKLHWFQEQARVTIAKTNIKEILAVLREKIAGFESHEKSNPKGVDYQFMIGLIEIFRHTIVHSQGKIKIQNLLESVERNTGHSLHGTSSSVKQKKKLIRRFTEKEGDHCYIGLIDKTRLKPPFHSVNEPLMILVEHLANEAALAYSQSSRHFGHEPIWKR